MTVPETDTSLPPILLEENLGSERGLHSGDKKSVCIAEHIVASDSC